MSRDTTDESIRPNTNMPVYVCTYLRILPQVIRPNVRLPIVDVRSSGGFNPFPTNRTPTNRRSTVVREPPGNTRRNVRLPTVSVRSSGSSPGMSGGTCSRPLLPGSGPPRRPENNESPGTVCPAGDSVTCVAATCYSPTSSRVQYHRRARP